MSFTSCASSGICTGFVTPWIVRSPVPVTETGSPAVAPAPSSIGSVSENVAVGNWSVSSASWTLLLRRVSFVVMVVRSTSMSAEVTEVPSMTTVPVTSPVRPTAWVVPIEASSSSMRIPANVPVAESKSNSPVSVSTVQVPVTPSAAAGSDPSGVDGVASATDPTAVSRSTSSGESSRRNQKPPAAMRKAMTTAAAIPYLAAGFMDREPTEPSALTAVGPASGSASTFPRRGRTVRAPHRPQETLWTCASA